MSDLISDSDGVRFPADCAQQGAPIYTFNELQAECTPEAVWTALIDALAWPEFYANCKRPVLDDGHCVLARGTEFHWTTFGVRVHTVVEEFEPYKRLAWRGTTTGGAGYHGWILKPTNAGCHIITEETQRGPIPWLGRWYLKRAMLKQHQLWLEGLARVSSISKAAAPT